MWGDNLSAILPVSLVSVILAGVMAGCYVHAGYGAELTDGKADLRGGAEALEKIDLYAIGTEDVCNTFCKHTAVVTTVVTHNHALSALGESLVDVVGKTLGGHTNNIFVHTVCTGTHDAAQTTGSELQALIEGIYQRVLVLVVQHSLNLGLCLIIIIR